jgi:hypothetical protein
MLLTAKGLLRFKQMNKELFLSNPALDGLNAAWRAWPRSKKSAPDMGGGYKDKYRPREVLSESRCRLRGVAASRSKFVQATFTG